MAFKDKTKQLEYQKRWYQENKDRLIQKAKKYYAASDKDDAKRYKKEYYTKNLDRINKTKKAWNTKNKNKIERYSTNARLLKKFNITLDYYEQLFSEQKGICYLCGFPETSFHHGRTKRLAVDHCHKTGKIRGLACSRCNCSVLGAVLDCPVLLVKIVNNYLQRLDDLDHEVSFDAERARYI